MLPPLWQKIGCLLGRVAFAGPPAERPEPATTGRYFGVGLNGRRLRFTDGTGGYDVSIEGDDASWRSTSSLLKKSTSWRSYALSRLTSKHPTKPSCYELELRGKSVDGEHTAPVAIIYRDCMERPIATPRAAGRCGPRPRPIPGHRRPLRGAAAG